MRIAIVYDRVNKWGGAERVLMDLHKLFPDAPLYTSVYNPQKAQWANIFNIRTSFLQNIPFASSNHELLPMLMPIAFESFSFDEFDLVISVTSEAAKGIITKPQTKHICYCLTPTRYLWSGYEEYFSNTAIKVLSKPLVSYLRAWDKTAAERPDVLVGISKEVQKRIKKYYGRDSEVIYPAVTLSEKQEASSKNQGDYFLIVSRLSKFTKYKRIDLVIEACNELKVPLKIVGTGNWENELKDLAGPTVEFLGNLTDKELVSYYRQCKALIYAGVEDFGLTIIEAQQFGKPVIAYRGGGATETIIEGKTGYFFNKQTKEALIEAIKRFDTFKFDEENCIKQAENFGFQKFKAEFLKLVNGLF